MLNLTKLWLQYLNSLTNISVLLGHQPSAPTEIWTKQEVKMRTKQAIKLLDDAESGIPKTGKFLYRAPTFYGKGINENRSPVLKGGKNPIFSISCRNSEPSDPFGNIPRKLKAVIDVLRMDEGEISYRIQQRLQEKQLTENAEKEKLVAEERSRRSQGMPALKTLHSTTQTDPTVCTDCLMRKIKVRYNGETQTDIVRTVDSAAQTKPMPVQTVTEFGSITELTPNQVKAVSELIKYIKLTVTSGTLTEMRDSLREDQVYNLNSDLRTAYNYFDDMVERRKPGVPLKGNNTVQQKTYGPIDNYKEPEPFIEDDNPFNEYDDIHKKFCADEEEGEEDNLPTYSNPLFESQQTVMLQRTINTNGSFTRNSGRSFGSSAVNYAGPSRNAFSQQQLGQRNRRGGMNERSHFVPFDRRN